ncbi:MAG: alkaline phosphatase family protein [Candidatus Acidiferrum sp.]
MLVVDQMRADYIDKFSQQWTGGLKRLLDQGAWFREAAYSYAATETCVGHATIATGALPATHGIVSNAWWDRDQQRSITCTEDPNAKSVGYAGASIAGDGDTAWRLQVPTFADELRFQRGGPVARVATFSLKARAAIMLAGHQADAVAWFDSSTGAWATSSAYGAPQFLEDYIKAHPAKADYGKTWTTSLSDKDYLYDVGSGAPPNTARSITFPHELKGTSRGNEPDTAFYKIWQASPFSDAYLTALAKAAVDSLQLGQREGTDYLAISFSALDFAGHALGPRSHEVQDLLVRLDKDLAELFTHLDQKVGPGKYVVALSADHGVAPIPEDMQKTGADAGRLSLAELQQKIESVLQAAQYPKPAVARIVGGNVYFAPGVYERLKGDPGTMRAVLDAAMKQSGVAAVYRAKDLQDRPSTGSRTRRAFADGYFAGRSGDLLVAPKAYWLLDSAPAGKPRAHGTSHGTPNGYDQRVPVLFMGFGIQPGQYYGAITPADIAPTLATLCGITLESRDGRVLAEALAKPARSAARAKAAGRNHALARQP